MCLTMKELQDLCALFDLESYFDAKPYQNIKKLGVGILGVSCRLGRIWIMIYPTFSHGGKRHLNKKKYFTKISRRLVLKSSTGCQNERIGLKTLY